MFLQVMRWMEQCSFIAASRVARGGHLLTAAMDEIAFALPTRVGDIMYITAQVPPVLSEWMLYINAQVASLLSKWML